jgi:hypothetical protein
MCIRIRLMDYEAKQQRRRENLRAIIGTERGSIAAFSRAHDIDHTLLSQLLNRRTFTESQARDIEKQAGLPIGILDEGVSATTPGSIDEIEEVFDRAQWMDEATKDYVLSMIRVAHDKNPSKSNPPN